VRRDGAGPQAERPGMRSGTAERPFHRLPDRGLTAAFMLRAAFAVPLMAKGLTVGAWTIARPLLIVAPEPGIPSGRLLIADRSVLHGSCDRVACPDQILTLL
jgi:hypothetical protein